VDPLVTVWAELGLIVTLVPEGVTVKEVVLEEDVLTVASRQPPRSRTAGRSGKSLQRVSRGRITGTRWGMSVLLFLGTG
jgi:hypothetical protein